MKLDGKIDEILDMIYEGLSTRQVAQSLSVSTRTLNAYVMLPENIELYKKALQDSGDSYADKAEEVLLNADPITVEISRARELAQHYRWMASKRSPKKYGDKLDVTTDGEKIQSQVTIFQLPDNGR